MTLPTEIGLRPTAEVLSCGLRVLTAQTRATRAVTIHLALQAGSVHDPAGHLGLAYFLSRVIDRGTRSRSAESIAETLDFRGVSLRVGVSRELLTVSCTCLVEDFSDVLSLVSDVAREAAYPETEMQTRRGEVLTAIRQDLDSPAAMAMTRLMAVLYGEAHPYGRLMKGTPESVAAVSRDDLLQFHRARVVPSRASLVVVGDVAPGRVMMEAKRSFDSWTEPDGGHDEAAEAVPAPSPVLARQSVVVPMMNKAQADVAYGFVTITRADPAYYAYWLMANILGQYGMGGRLGQSIRERQGMAYYAFCGFEAGVIPGPLVVRAGVHGDNVDRAIESIDHEITLLADGGVTEDEVSDSKRYIVGSLPRTLETNAGIAAFLQNVQQFDLGLDYDQRLPDLVESVTREAVNDAARHAVAVDRASVVVAGPYTAPADA